MLPPFSEKQRVILDEWLTSVLKRDAYRLVVDDELIEDINSNRSEDYGLPLGLMSGTVFMYAKVPSASTRTVNFLETIGFRLVDTNVTFRKTVNPPGKYEGHCSLRLARPTDADQVVELAAKSFAYSRFHMDVMIPPEVANTVKASWAGNYFAGKRGDEMIVAVVDQKIVGFLQVLYGNDQSIIIDLIAVDGNHRRRGIAADMIAYTQAKWQDFAYIQVGTQVANIPSMSLYENSGFRMKASNYVLHYHNFAEAHK